MDFQLSRYIFSNGCEYDLYVKWNTSNPNEKCVFILDNNDTLKQCLFILKIIGIILLLISTFANLFILIGDIRTKSIYNRKMCTLSACLSSIFWMIYIILGNFVIVDNKTFKSLNLNIAVLFQQLSLICSCSCIYFVVSHILSVQKQTIFNPTSNKTTINAKDMQRHAFFYFLFPITIMLTILYILKIYQLPSQPIEFHRINQIPLIVFGFSICYYMNISLTNLINEITKSVVRLSKQTSSSSDENKKNNKMENVINDLKYFKKLININVNGSMFLLILTSALGILHQPIVFIIYHAETFVAIFTTELTTVYVFRHNSFDRFFNRTNKKILISAPYTSPRSDSIDDSKSSKQSKDNTNLFLKDSKE